MAYYGVPANYHAVDASAVPTANEDPEPRGSGLPAPVSVGQNWLRKVQTF